MTDSEPHTDPREEIRCGALRSAREKLCIAQTELSEPWSKMLQEACDRVDQVGVMLCPTWSAYNVPTTELDR